MQGAFPKTHDSYDQNWMFAYFIPFIYHNIHYAYFG